MFRSFFNGGPWGPKINIGINGKKKLFFKSSEEEPAVARQSWIV